MNTEKFFKTNVCKICRKNEKGFHIAFLWTFKKWWWTQYKFIKEHEKNIKNHWNSIHEKHLICSDNCNDKIDYQEYIENFFKE